jgi:bifunctional oligoribonuclease and PAP phosphatase NrnA
MVEFYPIFQRIKDEITKTKEVLVIAHQNPDGDALGSLLGIRYYLQQLNVNYKLFCATPVPEYLKFLPHIEEISGDPALLLTKEYNLVIILDSGDLEYAGVAVYFRQLKGLPVVINIDHHPTNTRYGHLNLVNPQASSTAEIIYQLLDYFRLPIPKDVATALLTGILTDTGSFSNLGTTPSSMEAASRLMAYGAKVKEIINYTFHNKSLLQLQLWGRALSRLKEDKETGIVTTVLTKKDFDDLGLEESSEGIANFLNNVESARAVIVLTEKGEGVIKASMRTTRPDVDVSKIAKYFGGGGHKKAAGFSLKGKLVETDKGWKVIDPVKKLSNNNIPDNNHKK